MVFEDRLTIDTPEGVQLELTLAGVGSRFAAALLDYILQFAILVALALVLSFGPGSRRARAPSRRDLRGGILRRLLGLRRRLRGAQLGSDPREGGERAAGGAGVRRAGHVRPSAVRNVIRLVDLIPGMYLVGVTLILVTKGTSGSATSRPARSSSARPGTCRRRRWFAPVQTPAWDTGAIGRGSRHRRRLPRPPARARAGPGSRSRPSSPAACGRRSAARSPGAATRCSSSACGGVRGRREPPRRVASRLARLSDPKGALLWPCIRRLRRPPGRHRRAGEPPGRVPGSGAGSSAR